MINDLININIPAMRNPTEAEEAWLLQGAQLVLEELLIGRLTDFNVRKMAVNVFDRFMADAAAILRVSVPQYVLCSLPGSHNVVAKKNPFYWEGYEIW